jgi:MerR family transcriptional regulator, thiopeptide resistance regulator
VEAEKETLTSEDTYAVGEVARMSGVTVRTLHHYDEIGLVRPGGRAANGYRRYRPADLELLARVLAYRELGFGLTEIATLVADPAVDPLDHLRRQHALLVARTERLRQVVAAVEKQMEAREMGINLDPHEMVEVFGDHDPTRDVAEAEERWGDTDAYAESQRRASSYTKEDWQRMRAEQEAVERRLADALADGHAPDGVEAMDAAEAHRQQISRWFYDCAPAMHRGLADMYVADPRFTAHYEERAAGLAQYVHDAVHANADRVEGESAGDAG